MSIFAVLVIAFNAVASSGSGGAPAVAIPAGTSCLDAGCHASLVARAVPHEVAGSGDCSTCHVPDGTGHHFKLAAQPISRICTTCHDDPTSGRERIHEPVASGECTLCHDPHSASEKHLLRDSVVDLCTGCHSDVAEALARPHVHRVIRDLGCPACHDPHASRAPGLLRGSGNQLCLECHLMVERGPAAKDLGEVVLFGTRRVDLVYFQGISKVALTADGKGHPVIGHPVEGGQDRLKPGRFFGCGSCHDPHGSERGSLLSGPAKGIFCRQCHSK
jgi:predicted CXXCH cytochrome family protein